MGVEPGVVAIDLCCGDGLFTMPLARIAKRVYAIDIDPVMLNRARSRVAEARADNCKFAVADAMAVDAIVPEPVDYVFLANTFHGVPDQLGLGRAVAAVLKPKGLLGDHQLASSAARGNSGSRTVARPKNRDADRG